MSAARGGLSDAMLRWDAKKRGDGGFLGMATRWGLLAPTRGWEIE